MSFLLTSNIYYLARAADFTFQIFLNFIMSTPPSQTALIHIFSTTEIVQYKVSLTVLSVFQIAVKLPNYHANLAFATKPKTAQKRRCKLLQTEGRSSIILPLLIFPASLLFTHLTHHGPSCFSICLHLSSGKNDLFLPTS